MLETYVIASNTLCQRFSDITLTIIVFITRLMNIQHCSQTLRFTIIRKEMVAQIQYFSNNY